jgi:hypothetical protein
MAITQRPNTGQVLEKRDADGQPRHLLDGRPLSPGISRIDLLLADGTWLSGTYEWNLRPATWPALRFSIAAPEDASVRPTTCVALLPPDAVLRWSDSV